MEELMIKIENVSKMYKLGEIGGTTLRDELQRWSAKRHGREDPTKKIGAKDYNKGETFMALDGVSFEVKKGERVGIIGHNGAGKSTLLKLISRVTAPSGGWIGLNGRVASMLEVGTGFHGELTGRENIYMNGAILGMTKKEIDAKIEDIIEFSECRQFIDTPVKRYSSGMYVKLAFSVAAHLDSEIMIMDEVLAVGDINFQQKCLNKMKKVAIEDGRTVLYVSHNMETIRRLCSRCIVLSHGKIIFDGDVEEGISCYSNENKIIPQKIYDYENTKRLFESKNECQLKKVMIESEILDMNAPLNMSYSIKANRKIDGFIIRFVLINKYEKSIGTAYSNMVSLVSGDNILKVSFDTSCLAPDTYYVDLILCEYDGKIQIRQDIVNKAFAFTIDETKIKYNVPWILNGWGNIVLPDLVIEGVLNGKT